MVYHISTVHAADGFKEIVLLNILNLFYLQLFALPWLPYELKRCEQYHHLFQFIITYLFYLNNEIS
jgi:hypothetical protein